MKKKTKEFAKKHKDKMKGGLADKSKPSDFDKKQLVMGIKIEMEHTNDKAKAKEIAMDHLKEIPDYYTRLQKLEKKAAKEGVKKATVSTEDSKTKKIAKLIETHNRKKMHKSIDFRNTAVSIDSKDQELAEKSACPKLLNLIKSTISAVAQKVGDTLSLPLEKGKLSLYRKDEGLYSGFFQNLEGQVVEKFDDFTPEMVAKNLELKELYIRPIPQMTPSDNEDIEEVAEEKADEAIEEHNKEYHSRPSYVRVKCGDFEFEIRKSVRDFVNSFRKSHIMTREGIRKSIKRWAKNYSVTKFHNDFEAAKELSKNWDSHKEGFFQILFAEEELKKSK